MRALSTAKILIVDDQPPNVMLLESILLQGQHENVRSLTDPRDALPVIREWKPDLVLLDWMMPYVGGADILTSLEPIFEQEKYLPVLVLTADITPIGKRR